MLRVQILSTVRFLLRQVKNIYRMVPNLETNTNNRLVAKVLLNSFVPGCSVDTDRERTNKSLLLLGTSWYLFNILIIPVERTEV